MNPVRQDEAILVPFRVRGPDGAVGIGLRPLSEDPQDADWTRWIAEHSDQVVDVGSDEASD